jgi:hypothetical protein
MNTHFVQDHPFQKLLDEDETDYSERDKGIIRAMQTMEALMDLDYHILDYKNRRILYASKENTLRFQNQPLGFDWYDSVILPEDISLAMTIRQF